MENKDYKKEFNVQKSMAKGSIWSFSMRITQVILEFTKLIIVAYIITPRDFGLLGIALLIISILETVFQMGFNLALIQKKEDIKALIDSAWTFSIIRGLIIFSILFISAPYFAIIFNEPESTRIIQIIGLGVLFDCFKNISIIYFQKELNFKKQFIYFVSGYLIDFIITITFIIILQNLWAYVLGLLIGKLSFMILSYIMGPYKPRFNFNIKKGLELFAFSKWILISNILVFLILQGDDIFVGILLGATTLGFYQMAYKISNLPATEIAGVFDNFNFPLYSKLQDDPVALNEIFSRSHNLINFLVIPIAFLFFFLGYDIIKIVLGEQWLPIVPIFQILSIWAFLRSNSKNLSIFFTAIGKPKINTFAQGIQILILFVLIYPLLISFGLLGVAVAVVLSAIVILFIRVFIFLKITSFNLNNYLKPILLQLIFAFLSLLPIFFIKLFLIDIVNYLSTILCVGIYGAFYIFLNFFVDKYSNYNIIKIIKEMFYSLKP